MPLKKAVNKLPLVMLLLSLIVSTGCSHDRIILQGNQPAKLQQGDSAPFSGWLLGDEALARILEQAEACQRVTK